MNSLLKAEQTVTQLSNQDFLRFREWFYTFDNLKWDSKIENDIKSEKLNFLGQKALTELKQKKTSLL